MRLDVYLTKNFNINSRNKANELIKSSKVKVNKTLISKPSYFIQESDVIEVDLDDNFVSRSALKLKHFIEENSLIFEYKNIKCLDVGASTGGFTQVLLELGAVNVTCVDVGSNQLHPNIKSNPYVKFHENCDIRKFQSETKYDLIVSDVSFISLNMIIESINQLASRDIILLFKPQFEVGKDIKRDNNGVVVDIQAIQTAKIVFLENTNNLGWRLVKESQSKVKGKNGNTEFLLYFQK